MLDPACGDGQLLSSLLTALPFAGSHVSVSGFDTNPHAVDNTRSALTEFELRTCNIRQADFLSCVGDDLDRHPDPKPLPSLDGNPLPDGEGTGTYDCVIANPPYVRTQVLGGNQAQLLSRKFGLTGRVDLYQAFAFGISQVLRPGGVLGLLTSNRFLTVKAGASMRQLLDEQFAVKAVYDLGDTKLFDAAVLPVVLVAVKKPCDDQSTSEFNRVYISPAEAAATPCQDVLDALSTETSGHVVSGDQTFKIERGQLSIVPDHGVWTMNNKS